MAGTDFLDDESPMGAGAESRYPMIRPRRSRQLALLRSLRQQYEQTQQAQQTQAALGQKPPLGMGDLRKAEAELEAAQAAKQPQTFDEAVADFGARYRKYEADKAAVEEYRQYIIGLDPTPANLQTIKEADSKLREATEQLAQNKAALDEYDAKLQQHISGGLEASKTANKEADSYLGRLKSTLGVGGNALAWIAEKLQRPQRGIAAQMGYVSDVVSGRAPVTENLLSPVVIGKAILGDEEVLARGEQASKQWGKTMAPAFTLVAKVGGAISKFGEDVEGWGHLVPVKGAAGVYNELADLVAGVEDGDDQATREKKYAEFGAQGFFEAVTDPTAFVNLPLGKVGKLIKPIEPYLDKFSQAAKIKPLAKAIRSVTVGGFPLEDPLVKNFVVKSEAAKVMRAKGLVEEAWQAEKELQTALDKLPQNMRDKAVVAQRRLFEEVPVAERGGFVETPKEPILKEPGAIAPAEMSDAVAIRGRELASNDSPLVEITDDHINAALKDGRIPVRRMEGYIKIADQAKAARINAIQGTYYYFDPSSSEYLPAGKVLDAVDKVDAALKLGLSREVLARRMGVTVDKVGPGLGRFSQELNADIRRLAEKRGYDAVLLRSVAGGPGGRATTEVIDLLPRDYSVARIINKEGKPAVEALRAKGVVDRSILTTVQEARAAVRKSLPWLTPEAIQKWFPWANLSPAQKRSLFAIQDMFRFLDAVDYAVAPKWLDTEVRALLEQANLDAQTFDIARRALNRATTAARAVTHHRRALVNPKDVLRIWGKTVINSRDPEAARAMARALGDYEPSLARYADAVSPRPAPPKPAPSALYEAAFRDIPKEYRALVHDYAMKQGDRDALLLKMSQDRNIRGAVEASTDVLQGYARRRWSPEFQRFVAENADVREAIHDLKLKPFNARNAKDYTTEEVEAYLKSKYPKFKGDVFDKHQPQMTRDDYLFAADKAKGQAELEEFLKAFGKEKIADPAAVPPNSRTWAKDFAKETGYTLPPEFDGLVLSKHDVDMFRNATKVYTPGKVRKVLNRITSWVSRSVLATPGSLAKDVKGQTINAAVLDPDMVEHLDEALAIVNRKAPPGKAAALYARGLARPSFAEEVEQSAIRAIDDFGGGRLGKAAGAIEESGFVGGAMRGVGAAVEKIPFLKPVGKAISATGRGVGKVGRGLLNTRQTTEEVFRVATYLSALKKGMPEDEALNRVAMFWGDFSQLSKLESSVLKGFVMFFSWRLRALKIGAAQILENPFRTRLFLSLAAGNVSDQENFPEWARRQGGTIMGRDAAGNPKFISLGAGSPFEPIADVLQGEAMQRIRTDGFGAAAKGLGAQTLRQFAPIIQAPIEWMTDYDSFSNAGIIEPRNGRLADHGPAAALWLPDSLKKLLGVDLVKREDGSVSYVRMDPRWNWLFNKVAPGVGAALAQVNPLADPRKTPEDAALRVAGFPTYSVRENDLKEVIRKDVAQVQKVIRDEVRGLGLAMDDWGNVKPDETSPRGREMLKDRAAWSSEAKAQGINEAAYMRFKMGGAYPDALRIMDLAQRLLNWKKYSSPDLLKPYSEKTPDYQKEIALLKKKEGERKQKREDAALKRLLR